MYLSHWDLSDLYDALDEAIDSIGEAIQSPTSDLDDIEGWHRKAEAWRSLRTRVGGAMTELLEEGRTGAPDDSRFGVPS